MHCSVRGCHQSSESHQQGEDSHHHLPSLPALRVTTPVPTWGLASDFPSFTGPLGISLLRRAVGCTHLFPCPSFSLNCDFFSLLSSSLRSSLAIFCPSPHCCLLQGCSPRFGGPVAVSLGCSCLISGDPCEEQGTKQGSGTAAAVAAVVLVLAVQLPHLRLLSPLVITSSCSLSAPSPASSLPPLLG